MNTCFYFLIYSILLLFSSHLAGNNRSESCQSGDSEKNLMYTVEIFRNNQWDTIAVHNAKVSDYTPHPDYGYKQYVMGFCMFTDVFETTLKVRVNTTQSFSNVEIRPLSYGIKPVIKSKNTIEFELIDPSQKISVEFDNNRLTNLFILPDLPDQFHTSKDSNVIYFGKGVHHAGLITVSNKKDQVIYLDEGALVYGRIEASNSPNLSIRGRGILCSSQETHDEGRPCQMNFHNCNNLSIEGIMLRDTPNWTIRMVGCNNVHINNIKEIGWIQNSDGMDFLNCCNILVENTFQRNYDDNVTIKAFNSRPEYIALHTRPDGSYMDPAIWSVLNIQNMQVSNYLIQNCVFWADKAHNMLIGPESRGIPFSNIIFRNNIVLENRQNDDVYPGAIAIMVADNGIFENISFENIIIEDIRGGKPVCIQFANAWAFNNLYGQYAKNIKLKNIYYNGKNATQSWIKGLNDSQCIENITIENFIINGKQVKDMNNNSLFINKHVKNILFK